MIEDVADTRPETLAQYDEIIDVRSPSEFAEDHAPGAVNLPVLYNAQRVEVGTLYVQQSKFLASRIGAAMVSRNIADHLDGYLADKPGSFHPLIYCWRGGSRSSSMATILSRVGWRVGLLKGGYKTYRRHVIARLYGPTITSQVMVLGGGTGAGKTVMLHHLAQRGVQIIDLEGLACHRGSLFGAMADRPQPSQKLFESRLNTVLQGLDPARPVVVEAESSRIGEVVVPPVLWQAMASAPRVELIVPPQARARHIATVYRDIAADPDSLDAALGRLPRHHSKALIEQWKDMGRSGEAEALALALIDAHYDPSYRQSAAATDGHVAATLEMTDLSDADMSVGADRLAAIVRSLTIER